MRAVPLLLALTGCFQVNHRPTCAEEVVPVAEDHELGAWTPAELAARVEGSWRVPGTYEGGGEAEVHVRVARTGGAEQVLQTETTETTRSFGFGSHHYAIAVRCQDYLRIPVQVDVQTTDGAVDVVQQGYARTGQSPVDGPGAFPVTTTGPIEEAHMPSFEEDSDGWDHVEAQISVWVPTEDEGPLHGGLGWSGEKELDEGYMHAWFDVLTW